MNGGRPRRTRRVPAVFLKAEKALKIAVAKAIEDHRRTGDPIVVWENGRVVKIPADKIPGRKAGRRSQ